MKKRGGGAGSKCIVDQRDFSNRPQIQLRVSELQRFCPFTLV